MEKKVVKQSRCLQIVVRKTASNYTFVTVLYPNEKPESRFEGNTIVDVIKISISDDGEDYRDVAKYIQSFETLSDGMPITSLFEHMIRELLIKKGLIDAR